MAFKLVGPPVKKVKRSDGLACILCDGNNDKNRTLVLSPTEEGRRTLFEMAQRRNDEAALRIFSVSEAERLLLRWHRECYKSYTSEKNVQLYEKKLSSEESSQEQCSEDAGAKMPVCTSRHNSDNKKCVFCQKDRFKGDRTLHRVSEKGMASKLLEYSQSRKDHVFTRLSVYQSVGDIFAADVVYHPGCSKSYFRHPLSKNDQTPISGSSEADTACGDQFLQASFHTLLEEIDLELQYKTFELSSLTNRLKELCPNYSGNIDNRVMKRLLVSHYGEQLLFSKSRDRSKSSLIFKITIPLDEVVEQIREICTNRMEFVAG